MVLTDERYMLLVVFSNIYQEQKIVARSIATFQASENVLNCTSNENTSGKAALIAVTTCSVFENPLLSSEIYLSLIKSMNEWNGGI